MKQVSRIAFSSVDKHSVDGETPVRLCNYVDVYYNERITSRLQFMEVTATREEVKRFHLEKGDVIITKDSEDWSDIAVPSYVAEHLDGVLCGYHLSLIRPNPQVLDGGFLMRVFAARGINDQFRVASNGITRYALGKDHLQSALIPVPPLEEQRAIAAFLDRETARVDALIEKKHRQLVLLGDKRDSLINEAFAAEAGSESKRLGKRAIRDIPEDWDVLPMRRVIRSIEQGWSPVAEDRITEESEWCVLKLSAISSGEFRPDEHKGLPAGVEPDMRYEVHAGDLLITRSNTPDMVGDACVVPRVRPRLMMSDLIYRVRLEERRCLQRFACYWLISRSGRASIEADARGTSGSMVKISQEHIRSWPVPLPPIALQHKIVNDLDRRLSGIKSLAGSIHRSVELLREYRLALISAAVTGKRKIAEEVTA